MTKESIEEKLKLFEKTILVDEEIDDQIHNEILQALQYYEQYQKSPAMMSFAQMMSEQWIEHLGECKQAIEKAKLYDKFLEFAEKTQRIHEIRRGSEPALFLPREGITALIPMDFREFVEYQKLKRDDK